MERIITQEIAVNREEGLFARHRACAELAMLMCKMKTGKFTFMDMSNLSDVAVAVVFTTNVLAQANNN